MARTSITEKLLVYFILLSMGAIAIVGAYSYLSARKALKERTYNQLSTVRYLKKKDIELFYADRIADLEVLESDLIPGNPGKTLTFLNGSCHLSNSAFQLLVNRGFYRRVIIGYNNHAWSVSTDRQQAVSFEPIAFPEFIKGFSKGLPEVSDLFPGQPGEYVQYIRKAFLRGNDTVVLALEMDAGAIGEIMPAVHPLSGLGKSGEAYLVGRDRFLRTPSRFLNDAVLKEQIDTATARLAFSGHDGTWEMKDYRGISVLGSFSSLPKPCPDWAVIAEIDLQEAMVPVYSIRNNVIFITVFIACIVFAATWLISRRITRPLIQLQRAAVNLGEGKLGTLVEISSNDEIGDLAGTFNAMSTQLKEKESALNLERSRRMRAAFDGQDVERQRLSRELHDGLGQSLIAQKLRMESLKMADDEGTRKSLTELKDSADQLVDEVRRISNALMPAQLNQFGLIAALRQHCDEVVRYSGIEVSLEVTGNFEPMSRKIKTYLFRIVQEALNNVVKHSEASQAMVEIAHTRDHLFLSISDNGKGFDPQKACSGNGLHNMRERATLLSGELTFSSEPGNGTVIEIKIPCKG